MKQTIEVTLLPSTANDDDLIKQFIASELRVMPDDITAINKLRRSIDARSKQPVYKLLADVYINENPPVESQGIIYTPVSSNKTAHIVGFGPAGMFAALQLIELGIKPIVFERGKNVRDRRFDLRNIMQDHIVNPDSNYCFGEGGAGTYSDGKLYTRSTKRGDVKKILRVLVQHGASADILIDAHPHIGSNKLPQIIEAIRNTILNCGGEIHFNAKITDIITKDNKVTGVVVNNAEEHSVQSLILATGHSARDIFTLLEQKKIFIEAKPFAVGVRIEHPQQLINEMQYHSSEKNPLLPAASYNLSCQAGEKGVFSFCMCPGGIIVPASTGAEELVINGMSVSRRDSPFANSGFVVSVDEKDFAPYASAGALAGVMYQQAIEHKAFTAGGSKQTAPAQRVTDFLKNVVSSTLPKTSYIPGIVSSDLSQIFPDAVVKGLREGLIIANKKMRGYVTEEAQLLAAETRTSSPVRIKRDRESGMHVQVAGLFPAGEGAGYAGGIVSAAIDGEFAASAVAKFLR